MKNDAIIFDIDGTLWNASSLSAKGWNKGLEILGMPERVTAKGIESVAGNPYKKCIETLLPGLLEKKPLLLEILNKQEEKMVKSKGGIFYDGVLDGIQQLAQDFSIFIISNCQEGYLNFFLKFSNLEKYLQGFDCNGMSQAPKDQMITNMKNKYSLRNPVYVGDTAGDEKSSEIAGVEFIHASYGFGKPENKHLSFSTFPELVDYFKKM